MIEKAIGFKTGVTFCATLEEAQKLEIALLFNDKDRELGVRAVGWSTEEIGEYIIRNKDAIRNILTTTAKSRVRARKANGAARKTRKQIRKEVVTQFNELAGKSAAEMRDKIAAGKGVQ